MPATAPPGRSLATRQSVLDLVRATVVGSYGVTGFAAGPAERLAGRLGLAHPGIAVRLGDALEIDLDLAIVHAVPVAEVARQVDSAIRHAVRRGDGREVGRLTIHVGGLRVASGGMDSPAGEPIDGAAPGPRDLADSGTDVA